MKRLFPTMAMGYRALCLLASLAAGRAEAAAASDLTVMGANRETVIKVSVSGFSGEALKTLLFDLDIAGFTNTVPDRAQYLIAGSNADRLEGHLQDRITSVHLLGKAYDASFPIRAQAHQFANDIVQTLTRKPGIALTRIAFKVAKAGGSEIYVADYDGYNARPLTSDGSIVAAPAWSPGHNMLYYTSYLKGTPCVYSHDLSTGGRRSVARYSGLNTSAALSPDGRRLALVLSKDGSPDIFVANADGSGLKKLTATREDESSPCWSPDGQKICFAWRQSRRPALFTVPAAGGKATPLRTPGALSCTEPDWSPDGKFIAFTSFMGSTFRIFVLELATGRATELCEGEDPSWAPNSRTLVFTRKSGGSRYVLSLLDVPTRRIKDIAQISGSCTQPAWAR